jgi:myo-inositol-1(or 4)-monophosphatase
VNKDELSGLAIRAARQAGELLLERFRGPASGVGSKSTPTDLVSDADRDSERLLIDLISAARPRDGFLAEEGGSGDSASGLRWVIDPLDGTVNFLYGIPVWCVSVAVEDPAGAVVGVVYDPNRSETFVGVRGQGAWLNEEPIRVTRETAMAQALIGTGFAYDSSIRDAQAGLVRRLLPVVRDIRRLGSAALDLCALACGRLDGFYEAHMGPWDRAAGVLIVHEAGGVVSDLSPPTGEGTGVIAANPPLHDSLRNFILDDVGPSEARPGGSK